MLRILLVAATVALILGVVEKRSPEGAIDGASIYFAVIIIISVTSGNNYIKEK